MNKMLNYKKWRKYLICLVVLLFWGWSGKLGAITDDFAGSAWLKNEGTKQYKAVKLEAEVYRNSQVNLADLRIFDEAGQPVPYFVHDCLASLQGKEASYLLSEIASYVEGDFFCFEYVAFTGQKGALLTSLQVSTDELNFVQEIELWGSDDHQQWEKLVDDLFYCLEGQEKLEVFFAGEISSRAYYRLKVKSSGETPNYKQVLLHYQQNVGQKEQYQRILEPQFSVEEDKVAQKTLVTITGVQNLKIAAVTLETKSNFKRNVSLAGQKPKMLYNLTFKNINYSDTTLEVNGYRPPEDSVVLVIENKADEPLVLEKIRVTYELDQLIFKGTSVGDFQLKFGNSALKEVPHYDLANYQSQVFLEGFDLLKLQNLQVERSQREIREANSKRVLQITVVLVAVVLAVIIVGKLE